MKIKPLALAGIILAIIGVAGLVHPRVVMPATTNVTQTENGHVIIETRRIITIPAYLSAVVILAGGGLIFGSTQKRR